MEHLIGRKVLADVINHYGVTIIPAQTVLSNDSIKLLNNHRIELDALSLAAAEKSVEPDAAPVSSYERKNLEVQQAVSRSKELFQSIGNSRRIPVSELRREVLPAIRDLSVTTDLFELFEMVKAKDDYTYQHNVGVGIISTMIGSWMQLDESDLATLTLAATLHDIGKVKIPDEILNKPGKLTDEEFELVKKHTEIGYELLKMTPEIDPRVALVALRHHEREDGRGYPFGLDKRDIDLFSSIVAVADIFHAMSSERPYKAATPFHEIVSEMRIGKFGELNPEIVTLFLENVMKKLIGRQVKLTNEADAEVVYLNPHNLESPLVKTAEGFIDLSKDRSVQIKSITLV